MSLRQIDQDIYAAPQLAPEQMAEVAQAGFKSVVNNRPDFEEGPGQPTSAAVAAAAQAAGLQYRHLPVQSGWQTPEEAAQLAALLAELPRPVLLFCRSGARSTRLYHMATHPGADDADA
jgi:uncharacterized protein (TIGR01244 family)